MDKILSAIQPYLSLIKDLVTIASIGIAGYVALRGLRTWRDQLKGTANYELAKRLLKETYKLRDALQGVRNPFISAGEIRQAVKEAQLDIKHEDPDFHATSRPAVYQIRWKPVGEAYQALELEVIEAEAIWGPEARAAFTTIRGSVNLLNNSLGLILQDMQPQPTPLLDKESRETYRRVVYSTSLKPEDDIFLKELNSAITAIEELARPYLTR